MRKLLLLVLIITASVAFASPPVQDEKPPDQVVKVPVVKKEPTVELTEEETDPLMEDEADVDSRMVEPDSVPEETQVMMEEPVLDADYLTEETPETEQEPEPEITAIQTNRNSVSVEEAVPELESGTNRTNENETNAEIQMEPGRGSRRVKTGRWACRGVVLQGKCYLYFRINLDFDSAEYQCQSICYNGHLASVTGRFILNEIGRLMDWNGGRTRAWLGGRRIIGTNIFRWLDGTWWSYNGWNFGEPNNLGGMKNCVEMLYNQAFSAAPCTTPKPFICSCPL
ncbi:C-type lectin domain family 4 member G [Labeo rohita]|uniref:C-type lectin domain family 4 member G n=1 Tax=Labeo rohita TaxID=84645 RepID=A0ABQ8MDZ4_LABRO|nr:C-type lectin domain family 4 member G [Labeo rohita]